MFVSACLWKPARVDSVEDGGVDRDSASLKCPTDYESLAGAWYRYSATARTWNDARADCANDGDNDDTLSPTHLVVLAGDAERDAVRQRFPGEELWLGVSDRVETSVWRWVTREQIIGYPPSSGPPWSGSEPNDGGGQEEDCVRMKADGAWEDKKCDMDMEAFVCECDSHHEASEQSDPQQ